MASCSIKCRFGIRLRLLPPQQRHPARPLNDVLDSQSPYRLGVCQLCRAHGWRSVQALACLNCRFRTGRSNRSSARGQWRSTNSMGRASSFTVSRWWSSGSGGLRSFSDVGIQSVKPSFEGFHSIDGRVIQIHDRHLVATTESFCPGKMALAQTSLAHLGRSPILVAWVRLLSGEIDAAIGAR
jgi:hypothetical protein